MYRVSVVMVVTMLLSTSFLMVITVVSIQTSGIDKHCARPVFKLRLVTFLKYNLLLTLLIMIYFIHICSFD